MSLNSLIINYLLYFGSRYTTDGAGDDMLSDGAIPEDGVYAGIIFVMSIIVLYL